MEEWRTVVIDGEVWDNYEVSNLGRVRSLNFKRTGKIKELKMCKTKGYMQVQLHKNGKYKTCYIHRLVASAFIPNPENKLTVNHINEITYDNRVENLEWATMDEQVKHGTRTERTSKKVRCIETEEVFKSLHDVERKTGLIRGYVRECCKDGAKTCGGYHWEYVN